MKKSKSRFLLAIAMLLVLAFAAGCGGGAGAQRILGLTPDGVVKTFVDAAKADKLNEAALYVSPDSLSDTGSVIKAVTGQSVISELKNSNLLSVKTVAEQGDYAVVVATLQTAANSFNVTVKPVGLTRINGEWYIVDPSKIVQDVKYKILQQLLSKI